MRKLLATRRSASALALLVTACCGCGTGEYEKRLDARVKQLGEETPASKMSEVEIPGTPIRVRLPECFKDPPLVEGAPAEAPVDPRRVKPPIVLPDLKATYEAFQGDSAGGKVAYYCYLAVTEMSSPGARDPGPV